MSNGILPRHIKRLVQRKLNVGARKCWINPHSTALALPTMGGGHSRESARPPLLVEYHTGVVVRMCVEPGRLLLLHIDTAVAAISCEHLVTATIIVWVIRSRAIIGSPPAIMEEVATPVVLHPVVDLGIGIPECQPRPFPRLHHPPRLPHQPFPSPPRPRNPLFPQRT